MAVDTCLHAVKVLIAVGALASVPTTGVPLGTTKQLIEGWISGGALVKAFGKRPVTVETELLTCLNKHLAA